MNGQMNVNVPFLSCIIRNRLWLDGIGILRDYLLLRSYGLDALLYGGQLSGITSVGLLLGGMGRRVFRQFISRSAGEKRKQQFRRSVFQVH